MLNILFFQYFQSLQLRKKDESIIEYTSFEEIEKDFKEEKLHPSELKPALADAINLLLKPVRDHFANNAEAKKLMEKVKSYKVGK